MQRSDRGSWVTETHDWSRTVDRGHLADVLARGAELGVPDAAHLVLEVLAYADDEAAARGRRGRVTVTVRADLGGVRIVVRDDGRGTDTRLDAAGRVVRKPVMATRDVRFFDADPPVLLPDGRARRGMSVVAAASRLLVHTNRRADGAWSQAYRHGVPAAELSAVEPDGSTGTTVEFAHDAPLDTGALRALVAGYRHVEVTVDG